MGAKTEQEVAPTEGDLRVWWIPQIPMEPFRVSVPDVATGRLIEETLAAYDIFQFENDIKPDFSNTGGLERYEVDGDGGFDWFAVEEDDDF